MPLKYFHVDYCANWDGGDQEREAAIRFIKEVIPDAVVSTEQKRSSNLQVKIYTKPDENGEKTKIFTCSQRQLFKKNNWPAKSQIIAAVERAKRGSTG